MAATKEKKVARRFIVAAEVKPDLYGALKLRAEIEDRTLSAIFRKALKQFLGSSPSRAEQDDEARNVA